MLPVLQAYRHRNTGVLHVGRRANNLVRRSVGLSGRMDLTVVVPGIGTNCPEVGDLAFCIEISNVGIEAPKQQVLRQEVGTLGGMLQDTRIQYRRFEVTVNHFRLQGVQMRKSATGKHSNVHSLLPR